MLAHIKKLDDSFGQFMVPVSCVCGVSRHIEPEALARLVGWSMTLETLAPRLRYSRCGKKAAEVVAVARPTSRVSRRIRTSWASAVSRYASVQTLIPMRQQIREATLLAEAY